MILQLFRIRKTYKDIKDAKNDPSGFARTQANDALLGILIVPLTLLGIVSLLALYFGYVVEDGSGLMKVVFWVFSVPFAILIFVYITLKEALRRLKNVADKFVESNEDTVYRDVSEV